MCGICGEIRFDGAPASPAVVRAMTERLERRGPDAEGCFAQGRFAFGHRRLKIIDLSEAAQQPMVDNELGLGIVYNGAIYNYPELRSELQQKGYRFFSKGDTEVLLKAYHAWGESFVARLNGMFAFAIWERDSGRVVLGRDRLGIKPLYCARTPKEFRFASSLPAVAAGGGIDTSIDPAALHHYMTFHSVVPAPHTILAGVRKLPPATLMTIEPDGETLQRTFWEVKFETPVDAASYSEQDWQKQLLAALEGAIQRRMIADVPVGVLLSGGLDSSLVVGLLAHAGQRGLNTFSIGFESVDGEEGDEFKYSDVVVERFGTRHHKIFIDSGNALTMLSDCISAMSEPMVSHDAIGFYLLSREVAKHVKVVQSGQGADEVFAGYHWYPPMMASTDPGADYARVFFDRTHEEYGEAVQVGYAGDDHSRTFVEGHMGRPGASTAIDKALRLDTTIMLVDDPVKRVDNMTMAWGLEARVPFLDHEVVELAARIPAELKVRQGGKHILKETARSLIPAEVIDRPKGYFPVPALKYLQGEYLDLCRQAVTDASARRRELFRPAYVNTLLEDPRAHITPLRGSKLWQIALLNLWLEAHGF